MKSGGIIHTPTKPPKGSSMSYEKDQDLSFWISNFEQQIKGEMEIDLTNLQGKFKRRMENMEKNMENSVSLIRNPEENIYKGDDVAKGTHEGKDIVQVEQHSIYKNIVGGFDFGNVGNQGWFPRGNQLPNIDMRKFDSNDPITWISLMDQHFDLH